MGVNPPVKQFRHGRIVGSIWRHEDGGSPVYACTFERRFLEEDTRTWKSSLSFTHLDLFALMRVALDVAAYLTLAEASNGSRLSVRKERAA